MDRLTAERRSWNMSRVRSTDTRPEMIVRRTLHGLGFRYRLHVRSLPGSPDIVLRKHRTVIFVHGCFWHAHPGCSDATVPKTNTEFWVSKFQKNTERDERATTELRSSGWKVIVVWACQTKDTLALQERLVSELKADR